MLRDSQRFLGLFAFTNLAPQRLYLLLQLSLGKLQGAVLRLDLRQHLIESVGENANLIPAHLICADRVIIVVCNRACGSSEPKNRIGNETQKLT